MSIVGIFVFVGMALALVTVCFGIAYGAAFLGILPVAGVTPAKPLVKWWTGDHHATESRGEVHFLLTGAVKDALLQTVLLEGAYGRAALRKLVDQVPQTEAYGLLLLDFERAPKMQTQFLNLSTDRRHVDGASGSGAVLAVAGTWR